MYEDQNDHNQQIELATVLNAVNDDNSPIFRKVMIDPEMTWKQALEICDATIRMGLLARNGILLNKISILHKYTDREIASAWLIISRGYSERK